MLSCIWEEVIQGLISRYYAGSWLLEFYKFDFTAQLISINTHTLLDSFAHSSIAKDRIHSNWSKPRGLHYRLTEGWRSRLSAKLLRTPLSSWTYSACATKRKRAVTATADCENHTVSSTPHASRADAHKRCVSLHVKSHTMDEWTLFHPELSFKGFWGL